ncbi:MAG: hypothetical protein JO342_15085 [Solirubrobacterales bacterium]|nr:hypothetical protein [Solirubrobacterales bacterium]
MAQPTRRDPKSVLAQELDCLPLPASSPAGVRNLERAVHPWQVVGAAALEIDAVRFDPLPELGRVIHGKQRRQIQLGRVLILAAERRPQPIALLVGQREPQLIESLIAQREPDRIRLGREAGTVERLV